MKVLGILILVILCDGVMSICEEGEWCSGISNECSHLSTFFEIAPRDKLCRVMTTTPTPEKIRPYSDHVIFNVRTQFDADDSVPLFTYDCNDVHHERPHANLTIFPNVTVLEVVCTAYRMSDSSSTQRYLISR